MSAKASSTKPSATSSRKEKLAAALKANLRRRKEAPKKSVQKQQDK